MRYKLQQFVKTTDGGSVIGEGDVYNWIDKDGQFNYLPNAIGFAKNFSAEDIRIFDSVTDKPVWTN